MDSLPQDEPSRKDEQPRAEFTPWIASSGWKTPVAVTVIPTMSSSYFQGNTSAPLHGSVGDVSPFQQQVLAKLQQVLERIDTLEAAEFARAKAAEQQPAAPAMTGVEPRCADCGNLFVQQGLRACDYGQGSLCSVCWLSHDCEDKRKVEDPVMEVIEAIKWIELAFPGDMDPLVRDTLIGELVSKSVLRSLSAQLLLPHTDDQASAKQEAMEQVEAKVLPGQGRRVSPRVGLSVSPSLKLQQIEEYLQHLTEAIQQHPGQFGAGPPEQKSMQHVLEMIKQFRADLAGIPDWSWDIGQREGKRRGQTND